MTKSKVQEKLEYFSDYIKKHGRTKKIKTEMLDYINNPKNVKKYHCKDSDKLLELIFSTINDSNLEDIKIFYELYNNKVFYKPNEENILIKNIIWCLSRNVRNNEYPINIPRKYHNNKYIRIDSQNQFIINNIKNKKISSIINNNKYEIDHVIPISLENDEVNYLNSLNNLRALNIRYNGLPGIYPDTGFGNNFINKNGDIKKYFDSNGEIHEAKKFYKLYNKNKYFP